MNYFISAVAYYPDNKLYDQPWRHMRCFGYFGLECDAVAAVKRNEKDLHECLYNFCVVEALDQGIHPIPEDSSHETWFQWSEKNNQWEPIDKPEWSRGYLNWAIG